VPQESLDAKQRFTVRLHEAENFKENANVFEVERLLDVVI